MAAHLDVDAYRFCPRCGGSLRATQLKPGEPSRPVCDRCGHIVYLDPKVAVGTIIRNRRREIAMVRRAIEPGYGKWVFPGGYVDRGEALLAAASREALEESRLEIEIDGLVNVYSYPGRVPVIVIYAATHVGGELEADDESLEARWFGETALPWSGPGVPQHARRAARLPQGHSAPSPCVDGGCAPGPPASPSRGPRRPAPGCARRAVRALVVPRRVRLQHDPDVTILRQAAPRRGQGAHGAPRRSGVGHVGSPRSDGGGLGGAAPV